MNDKDSEKVSAEANGNFISEWTMPNRISSSYLQMYKKALLMLLFYFRYNNIIVYLCHTITFYKLKIKNGLYPDKVSWDIVLALDV